MCKYFNLKVGLQGSKFPWKSMGIYKFLYLRNSEIISNFNTIEPFKIHYFIMPNFRYIWNRILRNKYCVIIYKSIVTPTALGSCNGVPTKDHTNVRGEPWTMTGVSGERRESHCVTLQWCSPDQSKTMALNCGGLSAPQVTYLQYYRFYTTKNMHTQQGISIFLKFINCFVLGALFFQAHTRVVSFSNCKRHLDKRLFVIRKQF